MDILDTLILVAYVLLSISIISLILLQRGKGAETGSSFGAGASQTIFGSQGKGDVLSRTTAILATLFFVTSIGLYMLAKQQSDPKESVIQQGVLEEVQQNQDNNGDIPATNPQDSTSENTSGEQSNASLPE